MDALILDFTDYLSESRQVSASTLQSYKRDILQFLKFYGGNPASVTKEEIDSYMTRLKSQGRAVATIARCVASLKSFYGFLYSSGIINADPTHDLKKPKYEKKLPEILTTEEVQRLLEQPVAADAKGSRDKAMLELLYASGIRVSELVGLNIDEVNLRRGLVTCRKEGKSRTVPIGKLAVKALSEYIKKWRPELLKNNNEVALFLNRDGDRISRQGFWKILKDYKEMAGIDKEITPHMLRHSFASHLLENGADLISIQEMMGFSSLASTSVYMRIMENKIVDVYKKTHPRA